jgi:hypothetical protein
MSLGYFLHLMQPQQSPSTQVDSYLREMRIRNSEPCKLFPIYIGHGFIIYTQS